MVQPEDDDADGAIALHEIAASDPTAANAADVIDALIHPDREIRETAFEAFEHLDDTKPGAMDNAIDRLGEHLDADDADRRRRATFTTASLAEERPGALSTLVPELASIGGDLSDPSREPANLALARIAIEQPKAAVEATPVLLDVAGDPVEEAAAINNSIAPQEAGPAAQSGRDPAKARRDEVRAHAAAALTRIAATEPDAVGQSVGDVAALLADDSNLVRAAACEVLEAIPEEYPSAVEEVTSDLAERVVSDPKHPVPWRAADALVALGTERPASVGSAVAPVASDLDRFLDSRDDDRRTTGATLLAHAARVNPDAIEPHRSTLKELIDADEPSVRAQAVLALGRAGATDMSHEIARLTEHDPADSVQTAAERATRLLGDRDDDDDE